MLSSPRSPTATSTSYHEILIIPGLIGDSFGSTVVLVEWAVPSIVFPLSHSLTHPLSVTKSRALREMWVNTGSFCILIVMKSVLQC